MKQRKAYTREERRLMIIQALAIAHITPGRDIALTIADFAHALKITASTKLRVMVNEMVVEGLLVAHKENHPGIAGFRVIYQLPDRDVLKAVKTAQRAVYEPKRTIRINSAQGSFWEVVS